MKNALSKFGQILSWIMIVLGLFFGLGVFGERLWITTQFATIFYFMVVPFLIITLLAVLAVHAYLIVKENKKAKTVLIRTCAAGLAFIVLVTEIITFKVVAHNAGGKYSYFRALTMKDVQMSEPDEKVVYATKEGQDLSISVYMPKTNYDSLRPVYVYMHGGGWCSSDSETNSNIHRQMADEGYICFSINYRLCTPSSTENPTWDKAICDCAEAMNWIKEHAAEYGGNADKILLCGESAGGNLVLHYAGMTSEGKLDAPVPSAVFAMYPVVDLQWTADNAHYMTVNTYRGICEAYIGGDLADYPDRVEFVSPLTYMNNNLPPVLIMHGKKDTLVSVEGSRIYKEEADKVGADVTVYELPFSNHGTDQQVNRTVLLNWLKGYDGMLPETSRCFDTR